MQISVFGASGRIGWLVAAELLQRGYIVAAMVHSHNPFGEQPGLRVIQGDIYNRDDVTSVLQGSQAVISTLNSWHSPQHNILSSAIQRVIPAMESGGVQRIISLTGSDARDNSDRPGPLQSVLHAALNLIAPKVLRDSEDHLSLLRGSSLDWTVIRSPMMADFGRVGQYRLALGPARPWQTIQRRDVAHALVDQLETAAWSRAAPVIFRH